MRITSVELFQMDRDSGHKIDRRTFAGRQLTEQVKSIPSPVNQVKEYGYFSPLGFLSMKSIMAFTTDVMFNRYN